MTSSEAIANLSAFGVITITRVWRHHKGVDKFGFHIQFIGALGTAAAWGVGFPLTIFKLYAKCVEKGLVPDV